MANCPEENYFQNVHKSEGGPDVGIRDKENTNFGDFMKHQDTLEQKNVFAKDEAETLRKNLAGGDESLLVSGSKFGMNFRNKIEEDFLIEMENMIGK